MRFDVDRGEGNKGIVIDKVTGEREYFATYGEAIDIALERNGVKFYETLNDASRYIDFLAKGKVKVWFFNQEAARDVMMGMGWMREYNKIPDIKDLGKTHILLGEIEGHFDKNVMYSALQGENWSPNAESRKMMKALGLTHTSMCVGDIFEIDGKFFIVDSWGFVELK
jgi:hypothetical protein